MVSGTDIAQFLVLVKAANKSWRRKVSSLRFLLNAIDTYNLQSTFQNFQAVTNARNNIPGPKKTKYQNALAYLDPVLSTEQQTVSQLELVRRLAGNDFRVGSGLAEYASTFGEPFGKALRSMDDHSRWLDGGSGEAKAMIDYLGQGGKGRCTATGYAIPAKSVSAVKDAQAEFEDRFEYLAGSYFGDLSDTDLDLARGGGFHLITDLNGVLYYTQTVVEDLARYLSILEADGVLMFTNPFVTIHAPHAAFDPHVPEIAKWAANITGVKVTYRRKGNGIVTIKRTGGAIQIPAMTCVSYVTEKFNSPTRTYSCNLHLPNDPVVK